MGARPWPPMHPWPCSSTRGMFPNSSAAKHACEFGPGLPDLSLLCGSEYAPWQHTPLVLAAAPPPAPAWLLISCSSQLQMKAR